MATAPTRREQQLRVVTSPGAAEERFAAEASAAARGLDASRPQHAALPPPPPSPREALQHQAGEPFRIAGRATQNVPDTLRQLLPDRKHHGPLVTALPRTQSGGDGVTSQFALTIQPDIFKVETFDCEQFISSRRCLPLDTTKSELRSYLRQLKNELVELINKDYTDFISLSTSLVGTDKAIHELSQLLSRIRNEIQVIRDKFQETIDELEKRLAQRAELREQKAALQLLLNIARSVEKIASLLEAHHAEDATVEANEPGGRDKVNERVAIEFNQLRFLVGKGQEMSYVETIQPRIQKIESALRSSLATSLRSSLSACDASPQDDSMTLSLAQCLRTYAAIDQTREAEDIIAGEFVQPFIEKVADHPSFLEPLRFRSSHAHLE
ncbi:MAG: oligomeric golgi complex component, COG2-domain-containing protein [Olpidium bornovanus]|uniref:Conserved oligomeric Golgi complex subunit 2 n=1 Tax=Olpidium bornovanus TaxID=278681 RepID=A0A8H7ZQF2_9FUNG|nr:MAG: oligomeric golgi complex component, COG2-domain-containing protein [Olpidium bornovanus]